MFVLSETRRHRPARPGRRFVGAGAAFVVDILVSVAGQPVTRPKPDAELVGLVYSLTPKEQRTEVAVAGDARLVPQAGPAGRHLAGMTIVLNIVFG